MKPIASSRRIRFGDVGGSQQQAWSARMCCRTVRQGLHGEAALLCEISQCEIADARSESRDQMHPTGPKIHRDVIAE